MYTYDKVSLPNALRVIFLEMPHVHSVVCAAYVGMGSRFETDEEAGLSHLLEHMLFRGARGYKDSLELLEAVDDFGGAADAFTCPEYSAFITSAHARNGGKALQVLIDLLLGGEFRAADLTVERDIVLEEIAGFEGADGDYVNIDDMAYNLMWKHGRSGRPSFGTARSVRSFTVDDLRRHYERFFVPPCTVLCIAGQFDRRGLQTSIEDAFGEATGEKPEVDAQIADDQTKPRSLFVPFPSSTVQVKLCHKAFSYRDPQLTAMLIAADVLGGGVSSRLMTGVRERAGLVYDIACMPTLFGDVGSVDILTRTSKANLVKTIEAVTGELKRLLDDGITDRELRRTEESVFTQMHYVMDSSMDMASWFGVEELLAAPEAPETPEIQAEKVRNVSREELADVLRQIFQPDRRSMVVLGPGSWWQRRKVRRLLGE